MIILAIETSCDETGVAILEGSKQDDALLFRVLGNALLSQAALHAEYGGVYPTLAKREHEKNLPLMLEQALRDAAPHFPEKKSSGSPQTIFSEKYGYALAHIDAIVVTHGPGLEPALWTGIEFAKKLASEYGKPLIPVNHMEGHMISSLARRDTADETAQKFVLEGVELPVLALLISGGHTEFVLMREWFTYELIGKTLDDAVGEAFDKVARMLDMPYPGGPHISKHAAAAREARKKDSEGVSSAPKLPRPMLHSGTCDFSFSGLKTAALYAIRDRGGVHMLTEDERAEFAREFEDAVTDVLVAKTRQALEQTGAKTFVIGGGVAASTRIREQLGQLLTNEFPEVTYRIPERTITGDNAIMIAEAALTHCLMRHIVLDGSDTNAQQVPPPETIRATGNLSLSRPI